MGDFNAKLEDSQVHQKGRQDALVWASEMKEEIDTLVEWATSKNFKIMNTQFQKKAGRIWTWRSPDGNTKNEIDYIMTDTPSMVTDVTVMNRINIGSDHMMVMDKKTKSRKKTDDNTTVLDKQCKEIQEQDKIMERIEEFYSELYDSDQDVTIQTHPEEVPPIMTWEVEATLRKMKNGKEAGKDQERELKRHHELQTILLAIKLFTKIITTRLEKKL